MKPIIPPHEEIDLHSNSRHFKVPDGFTGLVYICDDSSDSGIYEWYEWYLDGRKHRIVKPAVLFVHTHVGGSQTFDEIYSVEGTGKGSKDYLKKLWKYVKDDPELSRKVMAEMLSAQESDL
jgi:hypothetical protein